jgi:hypothetical protein
MAAGSDDAKVAAAVLDRYTGERVALAAEWQSAGWRDSVVPTRARVWPSAS